MISTTNLDESCLETWDKRYNAFFGFPKVFTALSEIDDNVIAQDIRAELIDALQQVWYELEEGLGKNQTYVYGVDFTPLVRFKHLNHKDFEETTTEGGDIQLTLGRHISDRHARLFADYGALKMFTLQLISQGPFGPDVCSMYHTVLSAVLEHVGSHLPQLQPGGRILFNNKSGGIYDATISANPIEAIAKSLYKGLV